MSTDLKRQCHEIFNFWFFAGIIFPQPPEYTIRAVSNFFENSRRYSQLREHHRCRWFAAGVVDTGSSFDAGVTGVVDTGGAPWLGRISANFRKISKRSYWDTLGLGENWSMKKIRSKNSHDTVTLNKTGELNFYFLTIKLYELRKYLLSAEFLTSKL